MAVMVVPPKAVSRPVGGSCPDRTVSTRLEGQAPISPVGEYAVTMRVVLIVPDPAKADRASVRVAVVQIRDVVVHMVDRTVVVTVGMTPR